MSLKQKIVSGVFWQGLERVGSQGIGFVISIVLARLLAPKEFGVIALMTVFTSLCGVVMDSGFGNALIQKKDADQTDFCSVFYINLALGGGLYLLLFVTAPLIATFYDSADLSIYLRVSALTLIINSFSLIQGTLLAKRMMFYLNFRISWIALIVSGTTGIVMAYGGFGVWALISQQIISALARCFLLWFWVKWQPQWCFDWSRAKKLFQFGWKFLVSWLLDALYNDIYSIVIGKIANLTELGFYNRGKSIPMLGMNAINSTVGSVLFPAFSQIQNDRIKMRELARRSLQNIMFLVIPALTLLFILAEPLVKIVFTDKWLPCVIYLQLCCITFFYWPLHTTNLQIISACGRSDVFLILEIIKKTQAAVVVLLTYRYGVVTMVAAGAAMGIVGFFENAWFNRKLINYAPWTQLWDILPLLLVAVIVGGVVHCGLNLINSPWLKLLGGGTAFAVLYLAGVVLLGKIPNDFLNLLKHKRS